MDLKEYSLEQCLLAAIKSENESEAVYSSLAKAINNIMLKERLQFLAGEERKHSQVFSNWYAREFPDRELIIPKETPVPLPEVSLKTGPIQVSSVLQQAMHAEERAHDFYTAMAHSFSMDDERRKALLYMAAMEISHYKILEIEYQNAQEFEAYNMEWPMIHLGP